MNECTRQTGIERLNSIELAVRSWLEQVVIGLNLCPFAGTPYRNGLVRIAISAAATGENLLTDLQNELLRIRATHSHDLETTLLVIPEMLADFGDFNQFLDDVEVLLRRGQWEGECQVASFHPHYQFVGTAPNDPGNLTNRSPWPILHIIRESSIDRALAEFPDPAQIPETNIRRMQSLSAMERERYFPWLSNVKGAIQESNRASR